MVTLSDIETIWTKFGQNPGFSLRNSVSLTPGPTVKSLSKSDFFPFNPLAEIFFRSRGENYPLKNSKLDCLGGIFSGLKTILSKIVKNTTIWLSFFTFVGVKNGPFCQIFSGLIITTMSSKITNLTTIWPSFFSGLDVKNGLS